MNENSESAPQLPEAPASVSAELQRRLAFLEITAADREHLAQLMPMFAESAGEFVQAFYAHLLSFPDTARFLDDSALVARLKLAQQPNHRAQFVERQLERGLSFQASFQFHALVGRELVIDIRRKKLQVSVIQLWVSRCGHSSRL